MPVNNFKLFKPTAKPKRPAPLPFKAGPTTHPKNKPNRVLPRAK